MKKIIIVFLCVYLCTFIYSTTAFAQPHPETLSQSKTVKVGYFPFDGFNDKDAAGDYSGYGYDYLMEIAKYTGWEYEFVEASFSECLEMIENGTIDIIGSVQHTKEREEFMYYPHFDSGLSYGALFVKQNDQDNRYTDYSFLDRKTVGLLEVNSRNIHFFDFAAQHSFEMIPKYYQNTEELERALQNGEVDAIVTSNLRKTSNEEMIIKFDESFFYFGVTKNREDLLDELNEALANIKISTPNFQEQLAEKYYNIDLPNDMPIFSSEERDFLKSVDTVKLGMYTHKCEIPTIYNNADGYSGISHSICNLIEEKSGLNFEIIQYNDMESAKKAIESQEIDMIVDTHFPFVDETLIFSDPYFTVPWAIAGTDVQSKENRTVFCIADSYSSELYEHIGTVYPDSDLLVTKDIDEALDLCLENNHYVVVENLFLLEKRLAEKEYHSLAIDLMDTTSENEGVGNLAFAFPKDSPVLLENIINKSISSISADELNDIVVANYMAIKDEVDITKIVITCVLAVFGVFALAYMIRKIIQLHHNSYSSQYDLLTGLYTRKAILQKIEQITKQYKGSDIYSGIIFADIDDFKNINDTLGHPTGDIVISEIGKIIKNNIGKFDFAARYGGDEYLLFISDIHSSEALDEIAHQILAEVNKIELPNHSDVHITASMGGYIGCLSNETFDKMYHKADKMLYESKRKGKNKFTI